MKNIILGMIGSLIAVYTFVSCLSIYSISSRKNEMENSIAKVLEQNLREYYGKENGDTDAAKSVKEDLLGGLGSDSTVSIDVLACDMSAGILSVAVKETFTLPGGKEKSVSCEKTIIVESEEEEDEYEEGKAG
jgi:hypothetical protein